MCTFCMAHLLDFPNTRAESFYTGGCAVEYNVLITLHMVIPDSLIFEYIGLTNPMRYVLVLQNTIITPFVGS